MEQEAVQDSAEEINIDAVRINSIHFNKNCSVLTVNLKMSPGSYNIMLQYKLNTGSNGNTMPLHTYKEMFPEITKEQLAATKTKNILLKMYNKTTITQLGTCTVEVEQ